MRCEDNQEMLEAYVEGALDEGAQARVASHLSTCGVCAGLQHQLERELNLFSLYLLDVNPPASAWDALRVKIDQEKAAAQASAITTTTLAAPTTMRPPLWAALQRAFSAPSFALACSLLIVACAIVYVLSRAGGGANVGGEKDVAHLVPATPAIVEKLAPPVKEKTARDQTATGAAGATQRNSIAGASTTSARSDGDSQRVSSRRMRSGAVVSRSMTERRTAAGRGDSRLEDGDPDEAVSDDVASGDALLHKAEQQYQAAIAKLKLDAARRRIEPEVLAQFEKSLVAVNSTIARTQRAVREHPGDLTAAQYMLAAYSKKVDVLIEMTRH
jgi:hypothetical protein